MHIGILSEPFKALQRAAANRSVFGPLSAQAVSPPRRKSKIKSLNSKRSTQFTKHCYKLKEKLSDVFQVLAKANLGTLLFSEKAGLAGLD